VQPAVELAPECLARGLARGLGSFDSVVVRIVQPQGSSGLAIGSVALLRLSRSECGICFVIVGRSETQGVFGDELDLCACCRIVRCYSGNSYL
jgi:hypothetical protein